MALPRKRLSTPRFRAVGYDEKARALEVELNTGAVLRYTGVSPDLYRRLMAASAFTSFFEDHIEDAFPCHAVVPEGEEKTAPENPRAALDKLFGE